MDTSAIALQIWDYLKSPRGIPIIGVSLLTLTYLLTRKKDTRPPFPWIRVPIIGNMISLSICKEKCYELFYKTSKIPKYEGLFMIKLGGHEFVVLNNIDLVREAFIHKSEQFADRMKFHSAYLLTEGKSLSTGEYGPTWRFHRRLVHQSFRLFASRERMDEMVHSSTRRAIQLMLQETGQFEVKRMVEILQYNIFSAFLFNKEYEFDDPEFTQFKDMTNKGAEAGFCIADLFPSLSFIPFQGRKLMKLANIYFAYLRKQLDEHKENFDPDNPRDLVDYFLLSQQQLEREQPDQAGIINDQRIIYTLMDIFSAGIDTINGAIMTALGNMLENPGMQDKLYTEVKDKIGARLPLSSDRREFPYLEAFLCEAMRISSTFSFPVVTRSDVTLGKYALPKGTTVAINIWALHNDPGYWEQPEVFRPERFLDDAGELTQRPDSFLPFGMGKRACPGENLAKSMLMIILPQLIQAIEFIPPEGFKYELQDTGLGMIPKNFKLSVKQR